MNKILKQLGSAFLVAIAALFVVIACLLFRADRYVFSPEPLIRTAREQEVYTRVVPLIIPQILTQDQVAKANIPGVSYEQVVVVLEDTFSAEWLQQQLEYLITQFFLLKNQGTTLGTLDLRVSLQQPKQVFLHEAESLLHGNDLSVEWQPQLLTAFIPDSFLLQHFFIPKQDQQGESTDFNLHRYAQPLQPDELALLQPAEEKIALVQLIIERATRAIPVLLFIALLCIVLLVVMHSHSVKSALRWSGAWLFISAIGLLALAIVPTILLSQLHQQIEQIETTAAIQDIIWMFTREYVRGCVRFFGILGVIGMSGAIVAWVVAGIFSRSSQQRS